MGLSKCLEQPQAGTAAPGCQPGHSQPAGHWEQEGPGWQMAQIAIISGTLDLGYFQLRNPTVKAWLSLRVSLGNLSPSKIASVTFR